MVKQAKSFIVTLIIVLLIAYGVAMSAIGVYSFIKSQNLKQQIFSLTLARQELEKKTELISSQLENYEKEKVALEQSLKRLGEESKQKISRSSTEAESYKAQVSQLKQSLKKAEEQLRSLRKDNISLKQAPVKHQQRQKELKLELSGKASEITGLKEQINNLEKTLKDKEATMHYNLAVNFSQMKDFENAIAEYKKAIDIDPGHCSSHYNLGILYEEYKKDHPQAIIHYRRYLQLCPETQEASQIEKWVSDLEKKAETSGQ